MSTESGSLPSERAAHVNATDESGDIYEGTRNSSHTKAV